MNESAVKFIIVGSVIGFILLVVSFQFVFALLFLGAGLTAYIYYRSVGGH